MNGNRAIARVLVLAVLVVQFGLVQHSIEHGAPLPDAGCEVCVAGAHHAPGPLHYALPQPEPHTAPVSSPRRTALLHTRRASAHGVRAPPVIV